MFVFDDTDCSRRIFCSKTAKRCCTEKFVVIRALLLAGSFLLLLKAFSESLLERLLRNLDEF
jgi:hypothetical protein